MLYYLVFITFNTEMYLLCIKVEIKSLYQGTPHRLLTDCNMKEDWTFVQGLRCEFMSGEGGKNIRNVLNVTHHGWTT